MLRKVYCEVCSMSTLNRGPVDKKDSDRKKIETSYRKEKAIQTANEDVQYNESLSKQITVQHRTSRGNIMEGNPTCREWVRGTTHIGDSMARKNLIEVMLIAHKTDKADNVHQTPTGELKTFKREKGSSPSLGGDNISEAPAEEPKTLGGDNSAKAPEEKPKTLDVNGIIIYDRGYGA